jgi:hypothetical protein
MSVNVESDSYSVLFDIFTPKRYTGIGGQFAHPNVWARSLALSVSSTMGMHLMGEALSKGQVNVLTTALRLTQLEMPYYYVGKDYAMAVAATAIPKDMQFGEVQWPLDAITFGLPMDFVREFTGHDVEIPFISGAVYPHVVMFDALRQWPALKAHVGDLFPMIQIKTPRLTIVFADLKDEKVNPAVCASYGAAYNLNMEVADIDVVPHQVWSSIEVMHTVGRLNLSREDEAVVNRKLGAFFMKLLIVMSCDGPRYIEPAVQVRRAKVGKHNKSELWRVPHVGRAYTLSHDEHGTHDSPRRHLRRRHIARQAVGQRDLVVHVASLPTTPEGKIDWDRVDDVTKAAFWRSHRNVWVQDLIVNAGEREDDHRRTPSGNATVSSIVG